MASALTPTPAVPTTTVLAPDGADARTAASLRAPLTGILNGVIWLYNVLTGITAQAIHLTSSLQVDGSAAFNAITAGAITASTVNAGLRLVYGDPTTGTHTYDARTIDFVVMNPSGSSVVSGCVWQIAAVSYSAGTWIRFATIDSSTPITIKDPSGVTLASLQSATATAIGVRCYYDGTNWKAVDWTYR